MTTLYAYIDGSDLGELESDLLRRFAQFAASWNVSTAYVVNNKLPPAADLKQGDLPDWNLGLNFTVDRLSRDKIENLVRFLGTLARETGRQFVIGAGEEDWCSIGSEPKSNVVELLAEQLA